MKILMVLTSHDQLGNTGEKTGFWLEEFAAPYYCLMDAGVEITLSSPAGGQPPLDPKSDAPDAQTPATERFNGDGQVQSALAATVPLSQVNAADFDGVFYPGGHGPLWDLAEDVDSIRLIEEFLQREKPVAAVCHAPAVLVNVRSPDGESIVKGKAVCGFSNTEEAAVGLSDVVPFLLEDRLRELGGLYQAAEDWHPHAVVDGLLITGQNPASSELVARHLLERVETHG